jgi:glycerol-3-phosphate acyltransferase PlsY
VIVVSYLFGTLPSAVMVARSKGVDITSVGSGNPGASNIARQFGAKWGVVVFLLDAAKGAAAAGLGMAVGAVLGEGSSATALALACGAAAILGHMFPVTRGFRGGKGIATGGGILLVLHPFTAIAAIAFWIVVAKLSHKASVASILVVPLVPIGFAIEGTTWWEVLGIVGLGLLVEVRHLPNLRRLIAGDEPPVAR